ncbi:hypothetical protein D3C77_545930 [compost metagenome]
MVGRHQISTIERLPRQGLLQLLQIDAVSFHADAGDFIPVKPQIFDRGMMGRIFAYDGSTALRQGRQHQIQAFREAVRDKQVLPGQVHAFLLHILLQQINQRLVAFGITVVEQNFAFHRHPVEECPLDVAEIKQLLVRGNARKRNRTSLRANAVFHQIHFFGQLRLFVHTLLPVQPP